VGKGFLPASPSSPRIVRAGKTVLMQAFSVNCRLSRRGGSTVPRRMHREKRILFFANNAGMSMKTKDRCGKRGGEAGMFMKTKVVMR